MADDNPNWTEEDWKTLLVHIKYKQCTPFLGSGAAVPTLETGKAIARRWAETPYTLKGPDGVEWITKYPFKDKDNLVRVAQFMAVHSKSDLVPKDRMIDEIKGKGPPAPDPDEPHQVLASLDLPLYITTNYDRFMYQALIRDQPKREPRQEHCRWYNAMKYRNVPKAKLAEPTPDKPVVYHLHGVLSEIKSLVLTEDDYLNFLILISEYEDLLPVQVREAFGNNSLLFLGYSLEDLDFRMLFRRLTKFMLRAEGTKHVSVQLAPSAEGDDDAHRAEAMAQRDYLEKQLGGQDVKLYWKSCRDFAAELGQRWRKFNGGP